MASKTLASIPLLEPDQPARTLKVLLPILSRNMGVTADELGRLLKATAGLSAETVAEATDASNTKAGRRIAVKDSAGVVLGYIQLFTA